MAATVAGILLTGNHASRPSSGVSAGTLYSCTTHSLVYQTSDTGSSWSTWATLGTSGAYTAGGTDVAVADGGTGASTAPGAATNLGLGTGDSPQFTAINVGHASDTTLARSAAGVLTVEGNTIYAAGGTDVAVVDGGTGSSTAAGARTNLAIAIEMISDTTLGSDTANFDLTSIPGGYKHLMIEYQMRSDRASNNADSIGMRFNNDTGSNYYYSSAQHDGSSTFYSRAAANGSFAQVAEVAAASATAGMAGAGTIRIANYAGTTWQKTYRCMGTCAFGTTAGNIRIWDTGGDWASTVAITRVTLFPVNGSNFKTGSRVTLYGIS